MPPAGRSNERRAGFAAAGLPRKADPDFELRQVMRELNGLMGARGATLTLYPSDGSTPVPLFVDAKLTDQQREAMDAVTIHDVRMPLEDGQAFWRDEIGGLDLAMFLMPVDRLAGHGRLLISILLEQPDAEARANAERLYRERKPFATGFFHLWQQLRVLDQRARAMDSVLDRTAIGLVLLDRSSHIVFTNQTADEILAAGDGIGRAHDTLRAVSLADGINLQAALIHTIGGPATDTGDPVTKIPLLAFQRAKAPPIIATVLPAHPRSAEPSDVAAVMYLIDPRLDTAKMLSPLCRLYGLSPVETALACHLAAGETLASAAEAMRIKEQTARSYLKTIFIKTETKRQTELVVLMLSSLIRMKGDTALEPLTIMGSERALGSGN